MAWAFLDDLNPEFFPDPNTSDPTGLLALSADLGAERLIAAYLRGIFPWMKMDQPPNLWCWYSPDPRMVLYPEEFKVSRSLKQALKNELFSIRIDQNFAQVMRNCASISRSNQPTSWIEPDMEKEYFELHQRGIAHSIEAFQGDNLVGGLYGIALGKVFFGESMFHKVSEASKVCMAKLIEIARTEGLHFIDCQVPNSFLYTLGARAIPRKRFLLELEGALQNDNSVVDWSSWKQNIG